MIDIGAAAGIATQVGDLLGTFAFAISGALMAVRKNFDIVGIAVLACATAVGGGIIRDLVVGVTPTAFVQLRYPAVALLAALLIFLWHPPRRLTHRPLDVADAIGLGVFCVTGTVTAYTHGLGAPSAAALGVVTAVGGGIIRDILAGVRPSILHPEQEIYAVPAMLGAVITALLLHVGHSTVITGTLASLAVVVLRVLALRFHWRAPLARPTSRRPKD
ncbi:trimeric intracellular cation channel family protein [Nocardia callitridis]